jgi:hypothetical protein
VQRKSRTRPKRHQYDRGRPRTCWAT